MSDDLISRKAVIAAADRHTREDGTLDDDISVILEEVETTFDKKKVIKELKNLAEVSREYWSKFDDEDAFGEMNAYTRAIEIVEKGGVE
jgi:hypothetical protein